MDNQIIRICVFCEECHFSLNSPVYLDRNVKTLEKVVLEKRQIRDCNIILEIQIKFKVI